MAAAPPDAGGLLDLEKELTCSICTDILYQPLTLLDCLHTFCGSCLKEWFGWQRVRADQESSSSHRHRSKQYSFSCPSCRAVVRETRPNATVTTLLDMYIQANPARAKSQTDRDEIAKEYKPGDSVFPSNIQIAPGRRAQQREHQDDSEDEEDADRRLMEEVREMSLRETGDGNNDRTRDRHRRRREGHSRRIAERSQQREADGIRRNISGRLGHQSSLRSILSSSSHGGSTDVEEEIMRQIAEEGLLDGIDLDNIQVEQEDEISERIAQAYRSRMRDRSRHPQSRDRRSHSRRRSSSRNAEHRRRDSSQRAQRPRSEISSDQTRQSARPPASRPHLLQAADANSHSRQRSSSRGASRSAAAPRESQNPDRSHRASTDLSDNPSSENTYSQRTRGMSPGHRRSTDPEGQRVSEQWRGGLHDASSRAPPVTANTLDTTSRLVSPHDRHHRQPNNTRGTQRPLPPALFIECDKCGAQHIETGVYYSCTLCRSPQSGGTYDLCLRCYRLGQGCLHWFGFGYAAWRNYERLAPLDGYSADSEPPHVLQSRKYVPAARSGAGPVLRTGVFCDVCGDNANDCYWHCDYCNDGEWGFCNTCVNTAKHCLHLITPLSLQDSSLVPTNPREAKAQSQPKLDPLYLPTTCNACASPISPIHSRLHCPTCENGDYDLCFPCYAAYAESGLISREDGIDGWRQCLQGHRMLIVCFEEQNGRQYRVVLEGFVGGWTAREKLPPMNAEQPSQASNASGEGTPSWYWKDDSQGNIKYKDDHPALSPRDNGKRIAQQPEPQQAPHSAASDPHTAAAYVAEKTMRVVSLWPWIPEEGVTKELSFPKRAIIEEVTDINGDWWQGWYCGSNGCFPSGYGRVV